MLHSLKMRSLIGFLCLISILAGCGSSRTGQLRLIKVNNQRLAVIERDDNQTVQTDVLIKESDDVGITNTIHLSDEISVASKSNQLEYADRIRIKNVSALNVPQNKPSPEDTIIQSNEIADKALEAEKNSKLALGFSIGGLSIFIPFVGFLGIISFIIGAVFYGKANKSKYITPEGQRNLKISKVLIIIESVIIGIALLLTVIALLFIVLAFSSVGLI